MWKPSDGQKGKEGSPSPRHEDVRQAAAELLRELSEPMTAIQYYLEAAIWLHEADTRSASAKLSEVFEKSQALYARANETLCRLRDLMRQETETDEAS